MRPVTINPHDAVASLRELERASHEADLVEIAQNFSADNPSFTRTYQVNTTTPTAANLALVLATLISVMQKGGLSRTT